MCHWRIGIKSIRSQIVFKSQYYKCWRLPVGSFLVTCSWLNLPTYLTPFPVIGIYIVMFYQVLKTVMKLGFLMAIFIIAFGFGFHIMLYYQVRNLNLPTFGSLFHSNIKIMLSMTWKKQSKKTTKSKSPHPGISAR